MTGFICWLVDLCFLATSVPVIGSERQGLSSCPIWPGSRLVLRPGAKIQESRVESEGANFMEPLTVPVGWRISGKAEQLLVTLQAKSPMNWGSDKSFWAA